jgi:hypothetical protein
VHYSLGFLTERRGRVVDIPAPYSGGLRFKSRTRQQAILIEVFRGFPQSLQAIDWIIPKIRPRPLAKKSFPIRHHSFITPSSTLYSLVTEKSS